MKSSKLLLKIALLALTSVSFNSFASVISGSATDYNSTDEVGKTRNTGSGSYAGEYIKYYIPLNSYNDPSAPYTYGVDNFYYGYGETKTEDAGLKSDSGNVYNNTNNEQELLDMFVHFVIPEGEVGTTLTVTFKDLDLEPTNDPNYFNERLFLGGSSFGQGAIQEASYDSWQDLDDADSNGLTYDVAYSDGTSLSNTNHNACYDNDYMTLTISGLNISSGDYWFRMGFQAYSSKDKTLWNTAEYLKAEMYTAAKQVSVPEPSTILLMSLSLLGLASARYKRS